MSVLELPKSDIDKRETKAANGRFFYTPENPNESIYSRIINYTNKLFEHYKLNGTLDFMLIQLLRTEGEFHQIEVGVPGDNISLNYNGTAITGGSLPLWEVTITHSDGRSANQLMLDGGLYVVQKDYDRQGKLKNVLMQTDILSTWNAIEIILEDELTHNYLMDDIPEKYLKSKGSIDADLTGECKRLMASQSRGERFAYKCDYTPNEAKQTLSDIFNGEHGDLFDQAYKDGLFHLVNLRRYDTPQARFYVMIEILSELSARLQDQATDDTI